MNSLLRNLRRQPAGGFSVLEVMITAAIIVAIAAASFSAMTTGYEDQKLRQASIELQSYLLRARTLAQRNNGICQVTFSASSVIQPVSGTTCSGRLESLNLEDTTNVRNLCVNTTGLLSPSGSCTNPPAAIVFTSLGVAAGSSQTLYMFGSGNSTQYCIDLSLTLIRRGSRPSSSQACNYLTS